MRVRKRLLQVVCVVRVVGGPLYSLDRSVPAKTTHGNTENRLQEDQHRLPTKVYLDGSQGRFGQPHLGAPGHRLPLCVCLVGPHVGTSVSGSSWLVWSGLWASFACVTQDAICLCILRVFFLFRTCALENINLRKQLWS